MTQPRMIQVKLTTLSLYDLDGSLDNATMRETMEEPVVSEKDRRSLLMLEGARIGKSMTLPSGLVIPAPPEGCVWAVRDGKLTRRLKESYFK